MARLSAQNRQYFRMAAPRPQPKPQLPWGKTMRLVGGYHARNLRAGFNLWDFGNLLFSPFAAVRIHAASETEDFKQGNDSAIGISEFEMAALSSGLKFPPGPLLTQAALLWATFAHNEFNKLDKIKPSGDDAKLKELNLYEAQRAAAELVNQLL